MATPKLLLADDSVTIQRVIELTFADENVEVVAVGDGKEAIERLQAERPDIVLADIGMPERDGYEVAAFVKSRPDLSHIPVLLLTGAFEPIDEARARSVGCEGILVKPFEPQMVISRVRELLNKVAPSVPARAVPAPPAAVPEPAAPAPPGSGKPDALEDYFDRLDAALATISTAPPPLEAMPREADTPLPATNTAPQPEPFRPVVAKHSVAVDAPQELPAPPSPVTAATAHSVPFEAPGPVAPFHEAFAALLSAEQGSAVAPVLLSRESLSDEVLEEVVRRVLARMGGEDMRRAVLDSAERLVREEIERLKRGEP